MTELILSLITAFGVTLIAIPFTIILAKKYHLIDDPKVRPHPAHIQKRVIPRAGGLPILMGLIIPIVVFIPFDKHLLGLIIASVLLLAVGLLDDRLTNLSPYPRLLVQILAAVTVVSSGVGIKFITNPFGGIIRLDQIVLVADILALLWIVWMMNMVNWAKGVDGQMPGVITVAATIMGIFSYKLFLQGDPNQLNVALLSFITAGASLAFLLFNWYPSKILPGFSGSSILGLMVATLAILSGAKLAIAGLALLVPAVDFFYTFLRRIVSKKSPFYGDQQHLHHLLLKKGWSHPQIALFYILGSVTLGAIALNLESKGKLFAASLVAAGVLGGMLWLNFFGGLSKRPGQDSG